MQARKFIGVVLCGLSLKVSAFPAASVILPPIEGYLVVVSQNLKENTDKATLPIKHNTVEKPTDNNIQPPTAEF